MYALRGKGRNCRGAKTFDLTFKPSTPSKQCDGACTSLIWTADALTFEGIYVLCYKSPFSVITAIPGNFTVHARSTQAFIATEGVASTPMTLNLKGFGINQGAQVKVIMDGTSGTSIPVSCSLNKLIPHCTTQTVDNQCLRVITSASTYGSVSSTCASSYGMTLATVEGESTRKVVGKMFHKSPSRALWVGLRYSYGKWQWEDASTAVKSSVPSTSAGCAYLNTSTQRFTTSSNCQNVIEGLCGSPIGAYTLLGRTKQLINKTLKLPTRPSNQQNLTATLTLYESGQYRVCVRPSGYADWTMIRGSVVVMSRPMTVNVSQAR
eukprot:PhF_6_TR30122/c1_g1_i1/m.44018